MNISRFHSVADAAARAKAMLSTGEELKQVWRHVILQLLDDYLSVLRHEGVAAAAAMWTEKPRRTGNAKVDAALAALAEHLARHDGWRPPAWIQEESWTTASWWFVTDLLGMRPRALVESPLSFRKRGVFITENALERV